MNDKTVAFNEIADYYCDSTVEIAEWLIMDFKKESSGTL